MAIGSHINVPTFVSTAASYIEFRRRAQLFNTHTELDGKENQVVLLLLGLLAGIDLETSKL